MIWERIFIVYRLPDGNRHPQWPDPIGLYKERSGPSRRFWQFLTSVRNRSDTAYAQYCFLRDEQKYELYECKGLSSPPPMYIPVPETIIDTGDDAYALSHPMTEEGFEKATTLPILDSLKPKCNPKFESTHPQEPEPGRVRLRSL